MGADYLEQDVVATRDGELIVFHDLTLDDTTNVRTRFPDRARPDGHFYCVDFTLEEIRQLGVGERRAPGRSEPRYRGRFPDEAAGFTIVTLEEELRFIHGLMHSTGRRIGIYPEIKQPAWHREHGIELSRAMLAVLTRFGYTEMEQDVFVQCFDPQELQRLRAEHGCRLRLVQLLAEEGGLPSRATLDRIARYANAVGPSIRLIHRGQRQNGGLPMLTSLVDDAHAAGLAVHPYTFRKDEMPAGFDSFDSLLDLFLHQLRVDGVFTDFPDLVADFLRNHRFE